MNKSVEQKNATTLAWRRICLMSDAVTMGPLLSALHSSGLFKRLADTRSINMPADEFSLPRGFLHWSAALLEMQGLAERKPVGENADFSTCLTPDGSALAPYLDRLETAGQMIHAACRLRDGDWSVLLSFSTSAHFPGLAPQLAERMEYWQAGPLPAVIFHKIAQSGLLAMQTSGHTPDFCAETLNCSKHEATRALELMQSQGWLEFDAHGLYRLTGTGKLLQHMLIPLQYAVCYLDTISRIPEIFSGIDSAPALPMDGETKERHVDRGLDVELSGNVYIKNCRNPLLKIVLPMFDKPELEEQPSAIVDTGAGDASMLTDVYRAILAETERGRHINDYPLTIVAAEYNKVARDIAARRIRKEGIPGFAIFGDIADPAAIARELSARGINPDEVLHISKSVFHNRCYEPTSDFNGFSAWRTNSRRVFIDKKGSYITAHEAEWNLVECFRRWREHCGRHGIVVIEAHGVEYDLAAKRIGAHILTTQEATHGLSAQMLLPVEAHRRALQCAGFRALSQQDLGTALFGQALMSVDHWTP